MKTPQFWRKRNLWAELLLPFSVFTFIGASLRKHLTQTHQLHVPVICIGNGIAGGSGKTPISIALAQLLSVHYRPAVVKKSYRCLVKAPTLVDPSYHDAAYVGDEALEIAKHTDCWIGANRFETALEAVKAGYNLILLDDGMQDPSLHKDCTLLVVDGHIGFGNRLLLPAGPLRDRADRILRTTDAIIMIGEDATQFQNYYQPIHPIFSANIAPDMRIIRQLEQKKLLAFAGIAYPEKFFTMLESFGLTLTETVSFPDHHHFTTNDLATLTTQASRLGALLVCTEKDSTKLPESFKQQCISVPISMEFEAPEVLTDFLTKKVTT